MFYTSLETSKQLKEWGCDLKTNLIYVNNEDKPRFKRCDDLYNPVNAYRIIEDICVKYYEEFFGDFIGTKGLTKRILSLIQDRNIVEAEEYILKNCIFNPKKQMNKEQIKQDLLED